MGCTFGRDARAVETWPGSRHGAVLHQRCCIRFLQQGAARHWSAVAIGTRWVWEVCATTRAANLAPATDPVGSLALDGIGCRRKSPHAAKQPGARADARTGGRRPVAISHVRARAETCGATRRRRRGALPRRYDTAAVGLQAMPGRPAGCCGSPRRVEEFDAWRWLDEPGGFVHGRAGTFERRDG